MYAQLRVGWTIESGSVTGVITVPGSDQILYTLKAATISEALESLPLDLRHVFSKPMRCKDDEARASRTPRPVSLDSLFAERRFTDMYPELEALRDAEKTVLHAPVELVADCGQLCAKVEMWCLPLRLAYLLMIIVPNARYSAALRKIVDADSSDETGLPLLEIEAL
jgi:hypothetical protein